MLRTMLTDGPQQFAPFMKKQLVAEKDSVAQHEAAERALADRAEEQAREDETVNFLGGLATSIIKAYKGQ